MDRFYGLYRGIVRDNDDSPTYRPYFGAIKVFVPQVYGKDIIEEDLPWAEPCFPFGGGKVESNTTGIVSLPSIGSTVWVMFEQGDPIRPVWMGWWPGGKITELPSEAIRQFDSNVSYPEIFLIKPFGNDTGDGVWIRFLKDERVEIVTRNGRTFVSIQDENISLRSQKGSVVVESQEGTIELVTGRIPIWRSWVVYNQDTYVRHRRKFWQATQTVREEEPSETSRFWNEVEDPDTEQTFLLDGVNEKMVIDVKELEINSTSFSLTSSSLISFRSAVTSNFSTRASGFERR